jgi:hypothetical protein
MTESLLPLACPYCHRADLHVELETVGSAYLTREVAAHIECNGCDAQWDPDGTPHSRPAQPQTKRTS